MPHMRRKRKFGSASRLRHVVGESLPGGSGGVGGGNLGGAGGGDGEGAGGAGGAGEDGGGGRCGTGGGGGGGSRGDEGGGRGEGGGGGKGANRGRGGAEGGKAGDGIAEGGVAEEGSCEGGEGEGGGGECSGGGGCDEGGAREGDRGGIKLARCSRHAPHVRAHLDLTVERSQCIALEAQFPRLSEHAPGDCVGGGGGVGTFISSGLAPARAPRSCTASAKASSRNSIAPRTQQTVRQQRTTQLRLLLCVPAEHRHQAQLGPASLLASIDSTPSSALAPSAGMFASSSSVARDQPRRPITGERVGLRRTNGGARRGEAGPTSEALSSGASASSGSARDQPRRTILLVVGGARRRRLTSRPPALRALAAELQAKH